jgi:hypothetical protein
MFPLTQNLCIHPLQGKDEMQPFFGILHARFAKLQAKCPIGQSVRRQKQLGENLVKDFYT